MNRHGRVGRRACGRPDRRNALVLSRLPGVRRLAFVALIILILLLVMPLAMGTAMGICPSHGALCGNAPAGICFAVLGFVALALASLLLVTRPGSFTALELLLVVRLDRPPRLS